MLFVVPKSESSSESAMTGLARLILGQKLKGSAEQI
jgi:hypothetical protein